MASHLAAERELSVAIKRSTRLDTSVRNGRWVKSYKQFGWSIKISSRREDKKLDLIR